MRTAIRTCSTSSSVQLPERHRSNHCTVARTLASKRSASGRLSAVATMTSTVTLDQNATITTSGASVPMRRNLVVAVDQSAEAWIALKWTLENIYRAGDMVYLLHVIPQGFSSGPKPMWHLHQPPQDEDVQERVAESIQNYIQQNLVVLAARYNAQCEIDLVKGGCREAIGEAICKKSAELSASAVIVPGDDNNMLLELFKGGSVARHVAQHCTRPTIILH